MREDLIRLKEAEPMVSVMGMLTPERRVDLETLYSFLELARPLPVTFHKAIDETHDILFELNRLKEAGVDRVLSSGGASTALEGADMLRAMIHQAGRRMKIVAAGKITSENLDPATPKKYLQRSSTEEKL
jgi:copper homeostasis protein